MKPKLLQNSLFNLPRRSRRRLIKDLRNGTSNIFAKEICQASLFNVTTFSNSSRPQDLIPTNNAIQNISANTANAINNVGLEGLSNEIREETSPDGHSEEVFVHPYCDLSLEESIVLIAAFAFKHDLTKAGTEDLLTLLALHMPKGALVPSSYYSLMKDLNVDESSCTTHYVCSKCNAYINLKDNSCNECNFETNIQDLKSSNNFFFTFNPALMLKAILENRSVAENLAENLQRRNNSSDQIIRDITDGSFYKSLHLRDYDFSCSMNTDGVSLFRSSKFSVTPVLISINELDYNLRRENTLLVGLWFGSAKPNYSTFLKPIVEDCNYLGTSPIDWHANGSFYTSLVFFPIFVADSVARCAVQGLNQFNGAFGCPWCKQKGETCWITPTKHKWIYPPSNDMEIRTEDSFLANLESLAELLNNGESRIKHVNGVKYASPLLTMTKFNIVDSFTYDVMHSAFLGVSKMFTMLWIESVNSNAPYYIGNKVKQIDKMINQCKVPYEFDRTLRPTSVIKFWKASEWRSWTYIAFSITKGFLPEVYRKHFLKFANSIMLLCDERITDEDLQHAQDQLKSFVNQAKNLYGLKCCTFNLHILLHASDCVKKWGPLWAYSAFQFENFNGILSGMFRSSQNVITQIRSRFLEHTSIKQEGIRKIKNPVAMEYFQSLLSSHRHVNVVVKTSSGCVFLGPSKTYILSDVEKSKLVRTGINCQQGRSFRKCIIHGKVFSTEEFATTRRHNAIVATTDNKFYVIKKLLFVEDCENKQGFAIVNRINVFFSEPASSYLVSVRRIESRMDIINIENIQRQKFFTLFNLQSDLKFIVRLPNITELE